ncbi:DUF2249 domain-containing protein [bacterium]|nr:MAG: DUF2249 domain-containing protein [bacterium]
MLRIDVRTLPPGQRHQRVIDAFEEIQVGDAVELTAPHDPRGVRHEFEDLYAGTFRWESAAPDPNAWQVEVRKIASTSASDDVETVAANAAFEVVRVIVPAGGSVPERTVTQPCAIIVTAGVASYTAAGHAEVLNAGGVMALPPNTPYALASENGASLIVVQGRAH